MQISQYLWVLAPVFHYCHKRCFPSISLEFLRIGCLFIVFCLITMLFHLEAGSIFSGVSNHTAVDTYKVSWKPHFLQGESAKLPQTLPVWALKALTDLIGLQQPYIGPLAPLSTAPGPTLLVFSGPSVPAPATG